jgi:hypothetical protein
MVHRWVWQDKRLYIRMINVDDIHHKTHGQQVRIVQGIDKVIFKIFLLRVYYLNNFRWCYCKTCLLRPMQSRDNDKMLYSECNARYITMNVMHCWDCINGASWGWGIPCTIKMVQLPWCWPNDAYTMMQGWWYLQCMHVRNAWVDDAHDSHPTTVCS